MLLAHPSAAGAAAFAADDMSVITAGVGPGPWEVALSPDAGEIAHRKFDAVVVERLAGLGPSAALAPRTLRTLKRLTRRGGWFVSPAADGSGYEVTRSGRRLMPHPRLRQRIALAWRLRG